MASLLTDRKAALDARMAAVKEATAKRKEKLSRPYIRTIWYKHAAMPEPPSPAPSPPKPKFRCLCGGDPLISALRAMVATHKACKAALGLMKDDGLDAEPDYLELERDLGAQKQRIAEHIKHIVETRIAGTTLLAEGEDPWAVWRKHWGYAEYA